MKLYEDEFDAIVQECVSNFQFNENGNLVAFGILELFELLLVDDVEIQKQVSWIISVLVVKSHNRRILYHAFPQTFDSLLSHFKTTTNLFVLRNVSYILRYLAIEDDIADTRGMLLEKNIIDRLLIMLSNMDDIVVLKNLTWFMYYLFKNNRSNIKMKKSKENKLLKVLEGVQLTYHPDLIHISSKAIATVLNPQSDLDLIQLFHRKRVNSEVIDNCTRDQIEAYLPLFLKIDLSGENYISLRTKIINHPSLMRTAIAYQNSKICNFRDTNLIEDHNYDDMDEVFSYFDSLPQVIPAGASFDNLHITDPLFGSPVPISKIYVKRTMKSFTKPIDMYFHYSTKELPKRVIFKRGDDVRNDMMAMSLFRLFNNIWELSTIHPKPFIFTYKVLAYKNDSGLIEFIPNSTTLKELDWKLLNSFDENQKNNFIASVVGGFTASALLGIRDRHTDNMMICIEKGIFTHIDFGGLFNFGPLLDAPRFAIPTALKNTCVKLGWWKEISDLFGEAFRELYFYEKSIQKVATTLFENSPYESYHIINCLKSGFFSSLALEEERATELFRAAMDSYAASSLKELAHHVGLLTMSTNG
eukprot:TRINITY_DN11629_c0_g1_i1.p1 TRINITY_DN11629_c0_g1~~TRINITY_DN11629_c0_g1_i1.p1  ORF type:complete len:586 (+),score=105.61 TRINITY_DN11629_c0_g1_i1:1917-3674(+)